MTPEQRAREAIDRKLVAAGWVVQDFRQFDPGAGRGLAVREYPTDTGPAVNGEPNRLCWQIGQLLDRRLADESWGAGVIPRLARDLRNELPEQMGFSERNIKPMLQFFRACPPGAHDVMLMPSTVDDATRRWYAEQTLGAHRLLTRDEQTLRPLKLDDLRDVVDCFRADNRHERTETERFRRFSYDDLIARDKASLDIFWLKDDDLDDLDDLPSPDVLQQEIIDHLEAALTAFRDVAAALPKSAR